VCVGLAAAVRNNQHPGVGEHKTKDRDLIRPMTQARKCVVSFLDAEGVKHSTEVAADSLYEAAALALQQFRHFEWSREAAFDAATLRIEVWEPSTVYQLKIRQFEQWLARSAGTPHEVVLKNCAASSKPERLSWWPWSAVPLPP
jgi:hypothetical protein